MLIPGRKTWRIVRYDCAFKGRATTVAAFLIGLKNTLLKGLVLMLVSTENLAGYLPAPDARSLPR